MSNHFVIATTEFGAALLGRIAIESKPIGKDFRRHFNRLPR
jgi:hypothetical protein